MRKILIPIILILVIIVGAIYFGDFRNPYEQDVIYEKNIESTNQNFPDENIEVNNKRLLLKGKEVIKTILDVDINDDEYRGYLRISNEDKNNKLSISYRNISKKISEYDVTFDLSTGDLLYLTDLNNSSLDYYYDKKEVSKDDLKNIANEYIKKIPSINYKNYDCVSEFYKRKIYAEFVFRNKLNSKNIKIIINKFTGKLYMLDVDY